MGYSTAIYGVDLQKLKAAVGSNDKKLRDLALKAISSRRSGPPEDPTLVVTVDGELIYNGLVVSDEEFKKDIYRKKWRGAFLQCLERMGDTPEQKRRKKTSRFAERGSFAKFLYATAAASKIDGFSWKNHESEFNEDDEEFPLELAVQELLEGKFSEKEMTYQYGYALLELCDIIGKHLGTIEGKGRLEHLNLDTPLTNDRIPVKLPKNDDFPYISYLTSDEVVSELQRVQKFDLAYPKCKDTEADRKSYVSILKKASKNGQALVAFYH